MSLHIYHHKKDIPETVKYIACNDVFFNGATTIPDTEFATKVLSAIDQAKRVTATTFEPRVKDFGNLFIEHLSTGCKTLLNIISHPEMCFNVNECGNNALQFLPEITEGSIYWRVPSCLYKGDGACDIIFCGKHFTDFYDFLDYCREEINEFDEEA